MGYDTRAISELIGSYPRADLIQAPTIIHKLPRLSSLLNHDVFILREDLTGFALGGNKTRKVEYLFGDAIARGADTLVTMKATSFSRNAAVAASAYGLSLHVVLAGSEAEQNPASQAIFEQCGSTLHYAPEGLSALTAIHDDLVKSLRADGRRVYVLHPGGSDEFGALSYVRVFDEIIGYSQREQVHFPHIIHSTSSAGTQAGLVLGQCISAYDTRIVGVSAGLDIDLQKAKILDLVLATAEMLGVRLGGIEIDVDDGFIGPGYAVSSVEGMKAVKLFASLEGILLDQVYSGKAAAALLQYAKTGAFNGENILFIHTGGNAGLFY